MTDEEINVLFESKERLPETENLKTAHIQFVTNKEMVTEYLTKMDYIPYICTVITLKLTSALQTINFLQKIVILIHACM